MTSGPSPLAAPQAWDMVAEEYALVTAPFFRRYAEVALARAALPVGGQVLDVACGPGTLSLLAAEQGYQVSAVDFAPKMVAELEKAGQQSGLSLQCQVADGQALPFSVGRFDGAFSMFGLIFFPDRLQGFRELYRTLKPGGVAVISSWQPMERFELLSDIFAALRELLPHMPFGQGKAPLGEPAEIHEEMRAAGFSEIQTESVSASTESPTLDAAWEYMYRGSAPFALLRRNVGEEQWAQIERGIKASLLKKYGPGRQVLTMVANLGVGRKAP